ncbi:hypothetical protein [Rheinheimera faecalis]|uniref:hypothetical protein n=1 Tax=Rheinheimera faecalis TaxID=2901141 RepID=UPI001E5852D7|nr:hypothetical protein [Rheinheimera faecalis]
MNPISAFMLGRKVSKMVDIFEKVEAFKATYGSTHVFSNETSEAIEQEVEAVIKKIQKYQPHEITKVFIGHIQFNHEMGQTVRLKSIEKAFNMLLKMGVAMSLETFEAVHM